MRVAVVLGCAAALSTGGGGRRGQGRRHDLPHGDLCLAAHHRGARWALNPDRPTPVLGDGSILDNLQFFGFGVAELSGDRFAPLVDFAYVDIGFGDEVERRRNCPEARPRHQGDGGQHQRLLPRGRRRHVGRGPDRRRRGFWLETDFTLSGPNTDVIDASGDTNWFDGIIGARARGQYGKWGLTGQIDTGWGDDTTSWQGQALVEYDVSSRWRLMGGYRYLHFENDKGRVDVDLDLKGRSASPTGSGEAA